MRSSDFVITHMITDSTQSYCHYLFYMYVYLFIHVQFFFYILLLVCSVVFIISACASPFLGFMVDRVGKNIFWGEFVAHSINLAGCCLIFGKEQ